MRKTPRVFRLMGTARRQELEGLPLASFSRRAAAFMIDFFFVTVLVGLASIPFVLYEGAKSAKYHFDLDPFHGWGLLSLPIYYGLTTYWGKGRTIGKRLMHIRVISLAHEHLSLWHSIERSLGYGASFLEGGFGFLQYFIHPNCQTVHDRIAETIVISDAGERSNQISEPTPDPVTTPAENSAGQQNAPASVAADR